MEGRPEPVKIAGETELADSFRDYLESVRRCSRNTCDAYFSDLCEFNLFIQDRDVDILDVKVSDCKAFILHLSERGVSRRTTKRKIAALKAFYNYLIERGDAQINPFGLVHTPKSEKRLPDFLTPDQIVDLFTRNSERDDPLVLRDEAILELLFASGIRAGEAIALTLDRTDVKGRVLRVIGKGNKERLVPFSTSAAATLERYLDELRPSLVRNRTDGKDPGYVFLNSRGEKLTERGLEYILSRIGKATGYPDLHPHTLRHSYATYLVNRGGNLRVIQEFMGHSSIGTTAIYSHVAYDDLRKAYDLAFEDTGSPHKDAKDD